MSNVSEEIKNIAGREVEFIETTYKGVKGFVPVYINHNIQGRVSELMDPTEEGAKEKFLTFLKSIHKGDTDDPRPDTQSS